MAFDITALFAGVASGVGESIESRNKQIRNGAVKHLDSLVSEAEAKEKGLRTERDTLSQQAKQLKSYANAQGIGFTESQILGLIQQPETAKKLIEDLNNKKDLRDVDFASIFKVGKPGSEIKPEEYIAKKTSIVKPTVAEPSAVVRGAFGFESPAVKEAEAEFEATTGKKVADIRGIAKGSVDLGADFKPTVGSLDLSQFGNPETITNIQGKIRDNVANGIPLSDPKNEKGLKQLQANAILTDMFDKKGEGEDGKPRTASAINSVFTKALSVSVSPWVRNNIVRLVPETGDYVPVGGTAADVDAFQKQKNETIRKQAEAIGILDTKGKVIGGRNAFDALIPYANIEDGYVKSWRKPSEETLKEGTTPAKPASPATSSDLETPGKVILTTDGKGIDAVAMAKSYPPGKKIADSKGNIKIWNGVSLQ